MTSNILLNVMSCEVSYCVQISFFLFVLPVVGVDIYLMCEMVWGCAFVEESGQQNSKWKLISNTLCYFIYKLFSLTLGAISAGRSLGLATSLWGDQSDNLQSRMFLKGILPHFYSLFLFSPSNLCMLFCWRYCSLRELWSPSQSTRGLDEKKDLSVNNSLFKTLRLWEDCRLQQCLGDRRSS